MIVVIADDFSGAAELAGVAAGFGYRAEVQTRFSPGTDAEVVAVDTDSRLRSEKDAVRILRRVAKDVVAARPEWIYKKTDSVLRGHVRAEIEALLSETGLSRCLLVPANPSRDRIIRGGRYFVEGVPVDRTLFRSDPDFPVRSGNVRALLGQAPSIQTPDVESSADLPTEREAAVLPAGAADHFSALLPRRDAVERRFSTKRTLLMSGSLASWESGLADRMRARGFLVTTIESAPSLLPWEQTDRLLLAIGNAPILPDPGKCLDRLVERATSLVDGTSDLRIAIEGGATAIAFLRRLGWERFPVLPENHPGVGSLRAESGVILAVKPGSYPWPESLFPMLPSKGEDCP